MVATCGWDCLRAYLCVVLHRVSCLRTCVLVFTCAMLVSRMFQCLQDLAPSGPNGAFHRPNMVNGGIPAPPPTYVPPIGASFNT